MWFKIFRVSINHDGKDIDSQSLFKILFKFVGLLKLNVFLCLL